MKDFAVTSDSLEITNDSGHVFRFSDLTRDEAHILVNKLVEVFGQPETSTREEILAPEKVGFLLDSNGD